MIIKKKKVLLRAPLLTISGYGVHSRQIFDYLYNRNDIDLSVQILNWGMTSWNIDHESESGLIGKIMSCSKPTQGKFDLTVQVQLPDEWDPSLGVVNIGISAFVETDKCNPKWLDKCNQMDEIIVPSKFTKSVALKSGMCIKNIDVIPEHYNVNIGLTNRQKTNLNLNFDKKFNFLILGQLTGDKPENDRKNIENSIKWFCEAFEGNASVGLVLKTNMGKSTINDRQITVNRVKQLVSKYRNGKYPVVEIVHGNFTSEEIGAFYANNKIKCFLSTTRGEGYGLPMVDAAAAAIPIATPDYSGHMEFLESENICNIDYELNPIPKSRIDNRIFIEGSKWAEVDENDFKNKIVDMFQNYKFYKKKAQRMQQNIRNNFSREAVFEKYDQFFEKYLG
jgi:glycosyltransferase involved in cell wall biosynthesis